MNVRTGLGLDSHRFEEDAGLKPCRMGGIIFEDTPGLDGNSDADVILHALTDAISGVTGVTVIGAVADGMCRAGVTDSREYLRVALESLGRWRITHVSIAVECARPRIDPRVPELRRSIADLLGLTPAEVCVTATSGEGLSDCGRGLGVHATAVVTAMDA